MRRTKIVCTIGPSTDDVEILKQLIENGMNVARLNFSHGTHDDHARRVEMIRKASEKVGVQIAIMLDTKGPEIRTGQLEGETINLKQGSKITLTTEEIKGTAERISVSYKGLPNDVTAGTKIMIADGLVELEVVAVSGTEIECIINNGGEIGSRKNMNIPGVVVNLPAITEKDIQDIQFAIRYGLDFIAASFVRKPSDVLEVRKVLEDGNARIPIIAKIENHQGVENIDEILKVADGIMVARGDMGVEVPTEEVPLIQKSIIKKCNRLGKPVITATQMLDSMIHNPRPTRAEATDVANAIFDGTDAVMLSGETASGKYPLEAVKIMSKISIRTETEIVSGKGKILTDKMPPRTVTDAISHATCSTAFDLGASAIITSTRSGYTARMVSKYRPKARIIAVTSKMEIVRQLCLVWGVNPILVAETHSTDEMINAATQSALSGQYIQLGDLVVITAGVPVGVPGTTNFLKVHIVGEIAVKGTGIGAKAVTGIVRVVKTAEEALAQVQDGDILVCIATDKDYVPAMERCAAVVTEIGGLTSHAAIVGLHLDIPVIVGAEKATTALQSGDTVTIDGTRGLVYKGVTKVL